MPKMIMIMLGELQRFTIQVQDTADRIGKVSPSSRKSIQSEFGLTYIYVSEWSSQSKLHLLELFFIHKKIC